MSAKDLLQKTGRGFLSGIFFLCDGVAAVADATVSMATGPARYHAASTKLFAETPEEMAQWEADHPAAALLLANFKLHDKSGPPCN